MLAKLYSVLFHSVVLSLGYSVSGHSFETSKESLKFDSKLNSQNL